MRLFSSANCENAHRLIDVFQTSFAKIIEGDSQYLADILIGCAGYADATGRRELLQTGADINAITEDIRSARYDVAHMHGDPEL